MCDGEQGREGGAAEGEKEGGERASDLVDALERERMAVAATARLQEERTTLNERITLLTNETSRLETRLEHTTPQMELAGVGAETSTLTGGGGHLWHGWHRSFVIGRYWTGLWCLSSFDLCPMLKKIFLHEATLAFAFIFIKVSNVQICVQLDQRFPCMHASLIKSSI